MSITIIECNGGVEIPTPDITIDNHGSVLVFSGTTAAGETWLAENLEPDALRWGDGYVVEPRYAKDIQEGALDHGLSLGG